MTETMFGRIRSSSSPDFLERPPSKILKDDCHSIYETTLMKLKLGSQRESTAPTKEVLEDGEAESDSSSACAEAMNIEACYSPASFPKGSHELANSPKEDSMTVDSDYSTTSPCTTEASEDSQSTLHSRQRITKNISILYLFSKFKSSPESPTIMEEAMTIQDIHCSVMSPSTSSSQSTDNELHSEQEPIGYLTALSEEVL